RGRAGAEAHAPAGAAPADPAGRPGRLAVGRLPPAAPGRPRAGLRMPDSRMRGATDVADRRRDGSPVRGAREAEGARDDAALRLAPAAGSVPAVRPHHG